MCFIYKQPFPGSNAAPHESVEYEDLIKVKEI